MTTRKELAEMILESEKTGRKIQVRTKGGNWNVYDWTDYFLTSFEYRLEPKVVKHSGWFGASFLLDNARSVQSPLSDDVFVEWETKE
jgi:hypothetical protein